MQNESSSPGGGTNDAASPKSTPASADVINHPPHYTYGGIETIDVIEAWDLGFCLGNAVKYISRAGHKGSRLEDLRKAAWYLAREIERERIEEGLRELAAVKPQLPRHWLAEPDAANEGR